MNGADQMRQSRKSRLAALASRTARPAQGRPVRRQADEPSNAKPFQPGKKEDGLHAVPPPIAPAVNKKPDIDLGEQLDPKMSSYRRLRARLRRAEGLEAPPAPPAAGEAEADADPQIAEAEAKKHAEAARTRALAEAKKHGIGEAEAARHADASAKRHADAYGEAKKGGKKHGEAIKHAEEVAQTYQTTYAEARKKGVAEAEAKKHAEGAAAKKHADMMAPPMTSEAPPPMVADEELAEGDALGDAEAEESAEAEELAQAMDDVMAEELAEGGDPEDNLTAPPFKKEDAEAEFPPPGAEADGEAEELAEEHRDAEEYAEAEESAEAEDGVPSEEDREEKKDAEWAEMMSEGDLDARTGSYPVHLFLIGSPVSENPHYVVLVDGHAFGEIRYSDQPGDKTPEFKQMFCQAEAYADTIEKCVKKYGIRKTMELSHGRAYAAKVLKSKLAKQIRATIVAELEKKHREKLATVKSQYADWFAIGLEAFNKGVLTRGEGHPIKEELVKQLSAAKIHPQRAIEMIEAAFRSGGRRFSSIVAAWAADKMAKPREVQAAIVSEIRGGDHHVPVVASAEQISDEAVRALAMGNVPITSLGSVNPRGQAERYAAQDPGLVEETARDKAVVRAILGRNRG